MLFSALLEAPVSVALLEAPVIVIQCLPQLLSAISCTIGGSYLLTYSVFTTSS